MHEVKRSIVINKPARKVFDFTIEPANTPNWVRGVVVEHANESPTRLGTIYKNQSQDGSWLELEITDFKPGVMFKMTKKGDSIHVQYTFKELDENRCELEYRAWVATGTVGKRFSPENIKTILQNLKSVVEQI